MENVALEETSKPLTNRNPSGDQTSVSTHKSSFAGTRQPSEDSKNIRFVDQGYLENGRTRKNAPRWKSVARRLSMHPDLARIQTGLAHRIGNRHLSLKELKEQFGRHTTFHGISHWFMAPNKRWKLFWLIVCVVCILALALQIILLAIKYLQHAKNVDLDLKFENAPFPSVTICNLNPYKKSAINNNPATKAMMDAYAKRMANGDKSEGVAAALLAHLNSRVRRSQIKPRKRKEERRYHQAFAQCLCDVNPLTAERKGACFAANKGKISVELGYSISNLHPTKCLCQFDSVSKTLWPCFPYSSWKEKLCSECVDGSGHCPMRFYKGNGTYEKIKDQVDICLCHKDYNHCVSTREDGVILEIDPQQELSSLNVTLLSSKQLEAQRRRQESRITTTTEAPELEEALGFENITDDIALTAQAQQNLMFAVGSMTQDEKKQMSHQIDEFILKCSFNQKDCDLKKDFKLHYDNTYGNCYTFNHDRNAQRASQRAGANYGLRVLLYADVAEYLPTSEAVGFRITVHDKHIVPFPDAFGYSAPTGFMSSFGVRMKQFIRLEKPHGQCRRGGEEHPTFVYDGFKYSVEACHRSCAQRMILSKCGCADPMFPLPQGTALGPCQATDPTQRECLRNTTLLIGELAARAHEQDENDECYCHQPCEETNYEVTYSAARWPSGAAKVMECTPGDHLCLEQYRKNAAMIQIFYEELNYETLQETPSYTLTSLMADVGGVTGLWLGASVVSILEFVPLIYFCCRAKRRERKNSISSSHNPATSLKLSKTSLNHGRPLSHRVSVQDVRSLKSLNSTKSRSKQSILIEELPSPIQEQTDDDESSDSNDSSCRYLAPGEDLPCLCKYDAAGQITIMKALCPVHGYLVRRQYDYSVSNSEEEEEEDPVHKEEPYYAEPFQRKSTKKKHKSKSNSAELLEGTSKGSSRGAEDR
ncbi:unnamed protein product [Auanema sp. JU1783]|nr:unnamed protein product [Auanema sp. JU1783]